jgi:hypothetical protein
VGERIETKTGSELEKRIATRTKEFEGVKNAIIVGRDLRKNGHEDEQDDAEFEKSTRAVACLPEDRVSERVRGLFQQRQRQENKRGEEEQAPVLNSLLCSPSPTS